MTSKLIIHDFAGHPFQMQLSKRLAERGWCVTHVYFAGDEGPKGMLTSETFSTGGSVAVIPLGRRHGYEKGRFLSRFLRDLQYGKELGDFIRRQRPDVVMSGNSPTWIQGKALFSSQKAGARFVFWCQDFYSIAVADFLKKKSKILGTILAWLLERWEQKQFAQSDHVVHITDLFAEHTDLWGIPRKSVTVIPNWGALSEIDVRVCDNQWAKEHVRQESPVVLYSGTLGLKHNPDLISEAAANLPAQFVVVGFGLGYEKLRTSESLNVSLLPLQPFNVFSDVLGSAQVLIAVIEREAGNFSVPSKILSYLCAGRPIVLAAPADNLATSIIRESGAGLVVEPEDSRGFTEAIKRIMDDPGLAKSMGKAGRQYAEENFDIDIVTSRFEEVFEKTLGRVK